MNLYCILSASCWTCDGLCWMSCNCIGLSCTCIGLNSTCIGLSWTYIGLSWMCYIYIYIYIYVEPYWFQAPPPPTSSIDMDLFGHCLGTVLAQFGPRRSIDSIDVKLFGPVWAQVCTNFSRSGSHQVRWASAGAFWCPKSGTQRW